MSFNYLLSFLRPSSCKRALKPEELICVRFTSFMREAILEGKCRHVFFHVSNEGSSSGKQLWGSRQRNMGKWAGVSDYVFLNGNNCLALEIKDGKKPLSPVQKTFKQWCTDTGVPFHLATSYEEAVNIVKDLKIVS